MRESLILTDTDTTTGFVSQDSQKIDQAKKRPPYKHYIRAVNSLKTLKEFTRVPNLHKNRVRRAKKSSFIIKSNSFRVIKGTKHNLLLDRLKWVYSSSANLSGEPFDRGYAESVADIVIFEPDIRASNPSKIYRLNGRNIKKVR
jgi:tRNA A37 threonylcarbamoyladenosine synthetase subunit TsaC/SUA5/YrdC